MAFDGKNPYAHDLLALVSLETKPTTGDTDTGNANNGVVSYQGAPTPSAKDLVTGAAGEEPYTFEDVHPEFQYTRGAPLTHPVNTLAHLAPRAITRAYQLTPGTFPTGIQVLAKNPRRTAVDLLASYSASAGIFASNDLGALAGQAWPVPNGSPYAYKSWGELFVVCTGTGADMTLWVTEYVDD